jgi:hypothetical protein
MIKAHVFSVSLHAVESAANRTADDIVETGIGTAGAIPIPSATASAPMRPMYFALRIVLPPSMSWRNDARRVGCGVPRWNRDSPSDGRAR